MTSLKGCLPHLDVGVVLGRTDSQVVAFDLYRTVQHSTEVIRALVEDAGNEQVFGGCWSPES